MFDQERTEHNGGNDFDVPQIACGANETSLYPSAIRKPAQIGGGSHLQSVDLTARSARIQLWKRLLDVSCVLIAIPSLLPLILIVSALIKLTSKGPILFKQERIGFLGRKFTLFKFRTMIVGADTAAHETHVAKLMGANQPMIK